jgi:hypothetical protein
MVGRPASKRETPTVTRAPSLGRWCITHRRRVVVTWVAIAILTTVGRYEAVVSTESRAHQIASALLG